MNDIHPQIVKENKKVYKIMSYKGNVGELESLYFSKKYEIGKEYVEDIEMESPNNLRCYYSIRKGFHSYSTEKTYLNERDKRWLVWSKFDDIAIDVINLENVDFDENLVVAECVIPKGSKYYENEYGEIVSDHIIITGKTFKSYNK